MHFKLRRVAHIPKVLASGVLYVADEFGAAAHLCACGCGSKVRTPLSPVDWSLRESSGGPTLFPSIGNWQQPCKSHYWIRNGRVIWEGQWTNAEAAAGRARDHARAEQYFETSQLERNTGFLRRFRNWFSSMFAHTDER